MTINRRTFIACTSLATLAACSPSQQPAEREAITVGLTFIPNVQFCPFYLGVQERLFGNVDVTLRHHGEQEGLFEAVKLGREDIVFASADEAVVAGDLEVVATAYQRYPAEIMIAGEASSLEDLRGKSLGIPGRFGSSYYAALAALGTAGLTEQDVKLVEIGFTSVAALTTGKVDAIVGFRNNELVQFEQQGMDVTSLPIAPKPVLVGPSLITTKKRAKEPWVQAIVDGMLEAERRIVDNPKAAIDATAKEVPALQDAEQRASAERVLAATAELWKGDADAPHVDVDPAAMQRMEEFLHNAGIK
ncbi:ABC transporter substrate-binding protein [uncultured Tessaracoccus sp.]|uniref:ABC transporter substrate-binding protein n=1 Tax=uncultured Tessaracoccus sp. TaxID=905023 RepID=UPI002606C8AC|nr:ABC transporter substrate-binding protein [uncultured Tessaracoccus sp.]